MSDKTTLSPIPSVAEYIGCDVQIRPHHLTVFSYKSPAFCDHCGEMLFGFVRQGLKCDRCGLNFHKRCAHLIPNNCSHVQQRNHQAGCAVDDENALLHRGNIGATGVQREAAPFLPVGRPAWVERELAGRTCTPHTFQVHSYGRPTVCLYCKRLLVGLFWQGLQCSQCNFNVHRSCVDKVAQTCHGSIIQNWANAYDTGRLAEATVFYDIMIA
ncbi:serine/threonine-protein kinase D3-like [Haemaphysalis longicornis]